MSPLLEPGPSPSGVTASTDPVCDVTEILEPSCGVWWGVSPYRNNVAGLERAAGRPMDIVYTWHGIDQRNFPTAKERAFANEGRYLHVNVEARRFDQNGHPPLRYRQITRGQFDGPLRAQARQIADLGLPVFVTFDHEADANKRYNTRGTPDQFVQAWQHVVDVYRDYGADNAIFVWNVTGYPGNFARLPGLWPGNDYVDWISWEAYNMTGCPHQPRWKHVQSFEEAMAPMYEWIQEQGPRHGIDPDKPVMIGEAGTVPIPGNPRATQEWYAEIPDVLRKYERVRAVKFWDNTLGPTCDFRLLNNRYARAGFVQAGQDEYVNLPEQAREAVNSALSMLDQFELRY
ncbi:hypothetical protein Nans01_12510 [Nocardiopsis ansamitocini]|uniref:GH26 domain-containing protein n=2 Tax=Nocardiopsis ansamitocini TaxID=1670832 RepID=A0A9W6P408_9ACTN|nr:hypothetical protein Nans01_12510 [Nocardiopsis ansamitocini]